jgi:hypothetical protein
MGMGFKHVESGPPVRSSYHAQEQAGVYWAGVKEHKHCLWCLSTDGDADW